MLTVVEPGPLTTIQDRGRPGRAAFGVGPSGAADRRAAAAVNRLVGNDRDAAVLELTFGGLRVRADHPVLVALTGAPVPVALSGRRRHRAGFGLPFVLDAGEELLIGDPWFGVRTYLGVAGGIDAPVELGSRSTDLLAGLGPPPVRRGDRLATGPSMRPPPPADVPWAPAHPGPIELRVVIGPRDSWSDPDALLATRWQVAPTSDRIGVRLDGPPLPRRAGELRPEGLVRGAIQVPPDGRPIIVFADHPVTGGYPVVAVVVDEDTDRLAQARPGDPIRFRSVR